VDLRQMRQFVAVAEELHFGRAATRLNMAQPPLSQAIRRLEISLGVDLFNRSKRNVELSPAGHVFLVEARRTLLQADVARKMAQSAASVMPEVRISFIGPALYQVLPEILVRFRAAVPNVHARLFEVATPQQIDGILSGDYHIGFITHGIRHDGCESKVVERSGYVAAVPSNSPLSARKSISLAELAEQPFIMPPRKFSEQSETLNLFKAVGVVPMIEQEASQTNTSLSLVGAGLGCSLVMATAALQIVRNVTFLRIEDDLPLAQWQLAMAWHPDHMSHETGLFLHHANLHLLENPQLLNLDAYRAWL
jgi:DNA-binding transcriptional LysR family regulator